MFVLYLMFVLTNADAGGFEAVQLHFETQAECQRVMRWWIDHPDAELPGMDPNYRLLVRPIPASDCQPPGPPVS